MPLHRRDDRLFQHGTVAAVAHVHLRGTRGKLEKKRTPKKPDVHAAGEITPEGYGRGCIAAIGFDNRYFAIDCALIRELDEELGSPQGFEERWRSA